MPASTNLHLTCDANFRCRLVQSSGGGAPFRVIDVRDGDGNEVTLFLDDEQARELAKTILASLPAEKKEAA